MTPIPVTPFPNTPALIFLALLCCTACGSGSDSDEHIEKIPPEGSIGSIIRNPVSADGKVDTVNVAKLVFDQPVFDFGEIKAGELVSHVFRFSNQGKAPLLIHDAKSTCGCTVPQWPRTPIAPGDIGEIKVVFDTGGKKGFQDKPVTITANTYPSTTRIYLRGYVNEVIQ